MNTRHSFRWLWPALASVCLTVPIFVNKAPANKVATQPQGAAANANVTTADGLTVVTFTANPGTIRVNLPDDLRAGDTISGTVITEPKGSTKEERAANQTELNKMGIRLFSKSEDKPEEVSCGDVITVFKYVLVNDRQSGNVLNVGLYVMSPGRTISEVSVPVLPLTSSGAVITPNPKITPNFIIPPLGQTGRPVVITGPFDGNSSNTTLNWSALRSIVQNFEKNTENVSGGFGLIAESPRKAVFECPTNVTGPIEITLNEGSTQTKGTYRNVGVNLTAPKTSLLKGESTELHVEVSGLEGIKQPVPLTLESHGVIAMEGGMYQPLVIQPSQVGADGHYSTTRAITGVQAGGWGATATVVSNPFDVCLQDESSPQIVILFNTSNGNYIFTAPGGTSLSGSGTIARKGCIITLTDVRADRRVQVQIDTCAHRGSASVQAGSPKVQFTITDRNTADNTCAMR